MVVRKYKNGIKIPNAVFKNAKDYNEASKEISSGC